MSVSSDLICTGIETNYREYKTKNYQPWNIKYYFTNDRWEIIKEDGIIYTYGENNNNRNTIQYAIKWGNWIGNSIETEGAESTPIVWNLSKLTNIWGEEILFTYENRDIPLGNAKQTEASYLKQITDNFNRQIKFHYSEKDYPNEFMEPHIEQNTEDSEPITADAYQERYERLKLDSIVVSNSTSNRLFSIFFGYTSFGTGNIIKRQLISVIQRNYTYESLPGLTFNYQQSAANTGALEIVNLPSGGSVKYYYKSETIGKSNRELQITEPSGTGAFREPRVFIADDYVIVTWRHFGSAHSTDPRTVKVYVYQWMGKWEEKYLGEISNINVVDNYQNFIIKPEKDFFALLTNPFEDGNSTIYIFSKDEKTRGNWLTFTDTFHKSSSSANLETGNEFVAVKYWYQGIRYHHQRIKVYKRNGFTWTNQILFSEQGANDIINIGAANNYLIIHRTEPNPDRLLLYFLNEKKLWENNNIELQINTSSSSKAYLITSNSSVFLLTSDIAEYIYWWDEDYSSLQNYYFGFYPNDSRVFPISNTMFSVQRYNPIRSVNLRFTGNNWISSGELVGTNFSFGDDLILRKSSNYNFARKKFNPNTLSWQNDDIQSTIEAYPISRASINFYTSDDKIYYYSPDGSWNELTGGLTVSSGNVNLSSVRNGYNFSAYQRINASTASYIQPYKNGNKSTRIELLNRNMYHFLADITDFPYDKSELVGGNTVVTFSGSSGSFRDVTEFKLHRIIDEKVSGTQSTYAVSNIEVNDGSQSRATAFHYENTKATIEKTGILPQFNKVRVIPGSDASNYNQNVHPYGYIEHYFFNELPYDQVNEPYPASDAFTNARENYLLLTGMPYKVKVFDEDNDLKSSTTNYWYVYEKEVNNRHGYYSRLLKTIETLDGVEKIVENIYNEIYGLLIETKTYNHNSEGQQDIYITEYKYGWEEQTYNGMLNKNILTTVIQTKSWYNSICNGMTATTLLEAFPDVWIPHKSFIRITDGSTDFNFSGTPSSDWIKTSEVISYNSATGQILETTDIDDMHYSTKWNYLGFPAAKITNAKYSETSIADFEDGTSGDWNTWISGGDTSSVARTGLKGWHFDDTGAYTIAKKITIGNLNSSGKYIFSGWVKSSSNPLLQFGYYDGSTNHYPLVKTAVGTGEWEYIELLIDLSNYQNIVDIWLYVRNNNVACDWDDLKFYPANAFITTTTYDPLSVQVTSQTYVNNVTTYFEYDSFGRLIETRNDDGLVISENNYFSSVDKFGTFNTSYPNSVTQKTFPYGNPVKNASFELGFDNSKPKYWTWVNGCTVTAVKDAFTGTYSMKVSANVNDSYVHSYLYDQNYLKKNKTYKVSFRAKRNSSGSSSVDVYLMKVDGTTYKVWNHVNLTVNGSTWQHYTGTITLSNDSQWDNTSYLSVIRLDVNQSGHTVYFDDIQLEEGNELHIPSISVAYSDGLGRTMQTQTIEGTESFVSHIEYNSLGQPWRNWRTYKRNSITGYDPDFAANCIAEYGVNNPYTEVTYYPDPLGRVHKNYPLAKSFTGEEVETIYGKKTIPGGGSTEYNYTDTKSKIGTANSIIINRKYFDKLGRVIRTASFKNGQPEEHITQTVYNFLNQPSQVTDHNNFETTYEYNFLGRVIEKNTPDADPVEYIYDKAGRLRIMLEGEGAIAQPFPNILYWKYDTYGRIKEKGYINNLGWDRTTFQNYVNNNNDWPSPQDTWRKKYFYYDEENDHYLRGRLKEIWLNNDNDIDNEIEEYFTYDKYGNVTIHSTKANNFNSTLHATEYQYDNLGRVTKIKYPAPLNNLTLENMILSGGSPYYFDGTNITAGPSFTISNGANVTFEAGNEIKLLPGFTASGGSQFKAFIGSMPGQEIPTEVTYTYNQRGQVESIGIPGDNDYYALYTYNSDGAISYETLQTGINPTDVSYVYDNKGRLTKIVGGLLYFVENLKYNYEGSDPEMISKGSGNIESPSQTENYFGLVSETQFQFGWASPPQNYSVNYRYDDFGRLITADNSLGTQWDIGVGETNLTTYDQNGNVTKMVVGSTPKYYIYHTGSNKVKNTNNSGSLHYDYDKNGNLKSNTVKNLTITYDPFTQMTTQVSSPTAVVNFEYNSNNERLLKKENSGSSTLYLRGMNQYPLYEKQNTQGDGSFDKIYIYGPTGLIAVKRMEGTYFVMKDHLGSTRVIINGATGEPVNYFDFTPYGNTMRVGGGLGVKYQFTGQEYDDELGLHNFRARLYDSDLGIFYASDPAGQGFSPYSYCGGNPVIYVDKDGRWFIIDDLIVSAISFTIGYVSHGISTGNWGWEAVKTGGISAAASWVAWNTGGAGAGLFFEKGTAAYSIASSAIGSAAGSFTASSLNQLRYNGNINLGQSLRAGLGGFGGGLLGGAVNYYSGLYLNNFPGNNLLRHVLRSTAYEIGSNLVTNKSVFKNLNYGINPTAIFPAIADLSGLSSLIWKSQIENLATEQAKSLISQDIKSVELGYAEIALAPYEEGLLFLRGYNASALYESTLNLDKVSIFGLEFQIPPIDMSLAVSIPDFYLGMSNNAYYFTTNPINNYFWYYLNYWR